MSILNFLCLTSPNDGLGSNTAEELDEIRRQHLQDAAQTELEYQSQQQAPQPLYSARDLQMLAHLMRRAIECPELRVDMLDTAAKAFEAISTDLQTRKSPATE